VPSKKVTDAIDDIVQAAIEDDRRKR